MLKHNKFRFTAIAHTCGGGGGDGDGAGGRAAAAALAAAFWANRSRNASRRREARSAVVKPSLALSRAVAPQMARVRMAWVGQQHVKVPAHHRVRMTVKSNRP